MDRVLKSLRFDAIPVGDEIWALGEARKHLPPEADPDAYRREGGNEHRHSRAQREGDEARPATGDKREWKFRVTATGKVVPLR